VIYTGGAFDKKVYALDAATGTEKWTYTLNMLNDGSCNRGQHNYVTSTLGNKTYALNADTGNFIWSFQTGNYIYSSPAIVDGTAYFGSYDGNFYAIGQTTTTSGSAIPNTVYYAIVIVIVILVIAAAIVMLRKKTLEIFPSNLSFFIFLLIVNPNWHTLEPNADIEHCTNYLLNLRGKRMDSSIIDKTTAYDKNGVNKKQVDNAISSLKEFRKKFPFTENPSSIAKLSPDDIFNENSGEVGNSFII